MIMLCGVFFADETIEATPGETIGFIMGMHYSDQMTAACQNFRNLLCFVSHYMKNVKVVEPFLHPIGSTLGVCLSPSFFQIEPSQANTVKLSDIHDLDEWRDYAKSLHYAPIVSWNDFMKVHPHKIILVHHQWYTKECDPSYMINATKEYVADYNFEVVKQVCLNFKYTGMLTNQGLIDFIYGEYNPNEVVVVFNRWGGIVPFIGDYRFSVKNTQCYRGPELRLFQPSKQLSSDMKEYSKRYMNETRQYVAVMVRVGFFAINNRLKSLPPRDQHKKLMECFTSIKQKVLTVKRERNLNSLFLAIDVGKHGTVYFKGESSPFIDLHVLNQTVVEFFEIIFGKSFTQQIWEDSFESVARFKAPGYIAIMQKHIAANSVCLILAGSGKSTFHASAKVIYNRLHPESKCVLSAC